MSENNNGSYANGSELDRLTAGSITTGIERAKRRLGIKGGQANE